MNCTFERLRTLLKKPATPVTTFALLCIALFMSCSQSFQTFTDRDTKVDLKKYKTYAWIAPGDSVLNAPRRDKLFGGLIVNDANVELKKKGMVIDAVAPDALFMFETKLEDKVAYSQSPTLSVGLGFAGPGYYVGGSAPVAGGQITTSNYSDAMLVVRMFDTRTGNLIWTGGAKDAMDNSTNIEQLIQKALKAIFTKLPVTHKSK